MNIEKEMAKQVLLPALKDAIRYANLCGDTYNKEKYVTAHMTIVYKVFKSNEMRRENYLAKSIRHGDDLGLHSTIQDIIKNQDKYADSLL